MAKVVLLTGAGGFIGRRVAASLAQAAGVQLHAPGRAELDLRDRDAVLRWMRQHQPEVVLHLAAATAGSAAMRAEPARYFAANVDATIGLAAAVEAGTCGRVVLAHSAGAYPRPAGLGAPGHRLQPDDLWRGPPNASAYGLARRAVGGLLEASTAAAGCAFVELTLPTVYGPGDGAPGVDPSTLRAVPAFGLRYLQAVAAGATEVQHGGSGFEVRDFLHVDDAAAALIAAMDAEVAGMRLHVSDGVARPIHAVASALAAAVGFDGATRWLHRAAGQERSDDVVVLEPAGLETLGLTPQISLEVGLAGVVADLRARLVAAGA